MPWEVVFVDDGSTDGTFASLAAVEDPRVVLLRHEVNRGKGAALRTGFDAGKDIEFGVPVRPGDTVEVRATLHEVYKKTGRSGAMYFLVTRLTMSNQRGEMLAVIDNRFMHR